MKFDAKANHRYRASIILGFLEQIVENTTIATEFIKAGIEEVRVSGSGRKRQAIGVWRGPDTDGVELPSQIAYVDDLGPA